jgi:hypothetical protein
MSDEIIGPALCVYCGGKYGEHEPDCMRPALRGEIREVYNGKSAAEWYSLQAQQALHLAGAIMLLKQARNAIDVDTEIFRKIDRFLKHETNAE